MVIRIRVVLIALRVALGAVGMSCSAHSSAGDSGVTGSTYASRRMPDGKEWLAQNLNVDTGRSYCYDDAEMNCRRYGRLYTWESA
jgi:hypothetical protein